MLLISIMNKIKMKYLLVLIIFSVTLFVYQKIESYLIFNNLPIIIWWTPMMIEEEQVLNCPDEYKCLLTKNRNYINNTNLQAYLFYGSAFDYKDLPLPKNKIWAIFHEESPRNVALFLKQRSFDIFDIKSTFSRFSDFPVTLQYLENLSIITDNKFHRNVERKNKFLQKLAPVLYIQSDCDTPIDRDNYVAELMSYIEIDSYGSCLNNKKFPKKISEIDHLDLYNGDLLNFIAKYKFIVAFENAICDDYITEKLWRPLIVGSIPIYLGSPSVESWLPNPNSAILAKNFRNPKELADFIKTVNLNDTLYESFLHHKKNKIENELLKSTLKKGPFGFPYNFDNPIPAFECFVCEQLHKGFRRSQSAQVYNCLEPSKQNSWDFFWTMGDCESRNFENYVKTQKLQDFC